MTGNVYATTWDCTLEKGVVTTPKGSGVEENTFTLTDLPSESSWVKFNLGGSNASIWVDHTEYPLGFLTLVKQSDGHITTSFDLHDYDGAYWVDLDPVGLTVTLKSLNGRGSSVLEGTYPCVETAGH